MSPTDPGLHPLEIASEAGLEQRMYDTLASLLESEFTPGVRYRMIGRQVRSTSGVIDLVLEDTNGDVTIVELKVGTADETAVGQTLKYLGWFRQQGPRKGKVAALLIAKDFTPSAMYAANVSDGLQLRSYEVGISLGMPRVKSESPKKEY